jgi:hypothetical protein
MFETLNIQFPAGRTDGQFADWSLISAVSSGKERMGVMGRVRSSRDLRPLEIRRNPD